jgi:DNA-binding MarR family transcriptional regulator
VSRAPGKREETLHQLTLAGRRLSTATILFHQAVADRLGLNVTDHKCVDLLLLNGPLTAGELASLTALTTGAITAALDRLERAGFVKREDDPKDRRRVIVQVVPRRVADIGPLFDSFAAKFNALAADYKDEELRTLVDFMTRCCATLHEAAVELRQQAAPENKRKRGKAGKEPGPR